MVDRGTITPGTPRSNNLGAGTNDTYTLQCNPNYAYEIQIESDTFDSYFTLFRGINEIDYDLYSIVFLSFSCEQINIEVSEASYDDPMLGGLYTITVDAYPLYNKGKLSSKIPITDSVSKNSFNFYTYQQNSNDPFIIFIESNMFDTALWVSYNKETAYYETSDYRLFLYDESGEILILVSGYDQSIGGTYTIRVEPAPKISSAFLDVVADDLGRFTIQTSKGLELLFGYPEPWSSWSTAIIDGIGYTNYYDTQKIGTVIQPMAASSNKIQGKWRQGDIEFELNLQFKEGLTSGKLDNVDIQWNAQNKGTTSHQVGMRIILDTMVAGNDGASFYIPEKGAVTHELELSGNQVPLFVQVKDDLVNPTLTGEISFGDKSKPDIFQLADWTMINDTPDAISYAVDQTLIITDDSAVHMSWTPKILGAGQTTSWGLYYGLGDVIVRNTTALEVTLTGPVRLENQSGAYTPNPFSVQAVIKNVTTVKIDNVVATLTLPAGLVLASGSLTKNYNSISDQQVVSPEWQVKADGTQTGDLIYRLTVTGTGITPIVIDRTITVPPNPISPRVVLMEMFTADWCPYCTPGDTGAEKLAAELGPGKLLLLEYHVWTDDYSLLECEDRFNYYQNSSDQGVPTAFLDGLNQMVSGAGSADSAYTDYRNAYLQESTKPTSISISSTSLTKNETGRTVSVFADICNNGSVAVSGLVGYVVIYEDVLTDQHHYVVRDIIPPVNLQTMNPGACIPLSVTSAALGSTVKMQNIHAVVFVQNPSSSKKEIYQAALVAGTPTFVLGGNEYSSAVPGTTIDVPIQITNLPSCTAIQFDVVYDTHILTYGNQIIKNDTLLSSWNQVDGNSLASNKLRIAAYAGAGAAAAGTGNLVYIRFIVTSSVASGTSLTLTFENLKDGVAQAVASPVKISFGITLGDLNRDGSITAADSQIDFDIAIGRRTPSDYEKIAGEVTGDGVITAADAQLIFEWAREGRALIPSLQYGQAELIIPSSRKIFPFSTSQVTIDTVNGSPGHEVIVPITLNPGGSITALTIDMAYDNNKLDFVRIDKANTLVANFGAADAYSSIPASLRVLASAFSAPPITSSGVLVNLVFTVKNGTSGSAAISFVSVKDDLVGAATIDGGVNILIVGIKNYDIY